MGGIRRPDMPTGVVPKKPTAHVGFAASLVTGISRPLTNTEDWTLYYFEDHAQSCPACHNPYKVHKASKQLCDQGHQLAVDVADLLFRLRLDGEVYSRTQNESQEVRVEIPCKYLQVAQLFKAIQRSGRGFLKQTPSYDKHYYVGPRLAAARSPDAARRPAAPAAASNTHKVRVVEPSLPTTTTSRSSQHHHSPRRSGSSQRHHAELPVKVKRGSLYETDLLALEEARQRESRFQYTLEVREPSSSRRHAGYV
jgi:hypothetical protein